MKIYLNNLNESWIIDRLREDWYLNNKDISTNEPSKSDLIWLIAPWVWKKVPKKILAKKKVVCSIYHIDFKKFNKSEERDFQKRDKYVDFYHVISKKNKYELQKLTNKKIISIPFWVNQNIFKKIENSSELRNSMGFENKDYLIGSFQRDTEGKDLKSPKLIKGPDIFLKIIKEEYKLEPNLKVVLAGKRRQYLIRELEKENVPFEYFEMVDPEELNILYNILDLYIVSSRLEGGPQAILECAISKTPIISTDVGVASEILSNESIFVNEDGYKTATPNVDEAYLNAKKFIIPNGMEEYRKAFKEHYEN